MSVIIVGDVHGCVDEFRQLIELAGFDPSRDSVVSVGDIIDKGPDPLGAIKFARSIGCQMIMGNHEDKFRRWRRNERVRAATGRANEIKVSSERAAQWAAFSDEDEAYIVSSPWKIEVSGHVVVHAGMMPGVAISDQNPKVAMRVRRIAAGKFSDESGAVHWAQVWDQPYNVIVGHEVHSMTDVRVDVSSTGHKVWSIDTGCVHGGRLSAVVIAEDGTCEVVQVQASKVYSMSRE